MGHESLCGMEWIMPDRTKIEANAIVPTGGDVRLVAGRTGPAPAGWLAERAL
jgi:hypothetical protein